MDPKTAARRGEHESAPSDACARIRADLERLGVARTVSGVVSERLAAIAADLTPAEYAVVLESVAAAHGAPSDQTRTQQGSAVEIQRLIQDFASELRKLDEGLLVLTAYLVRLRDRAAPMSTRLLH